MSAQIKVVSFNFQSKSYVLLIDSAMFVCLLC